VPANGDKGKRFPAGAAEFQKNTAPADDAPPLTEVVPPLPEPDLTFPEFPWLLMLMRIGGVLGRREVDRRMGSERRRRMKFISVWRSTDN
jgi:hypothetical protein